MGKQEQVISEMNTYFISRGIRMIDSEDLASKFDTEPIKIPGSAKSVPLSERVDS